MRFASFDTLQRALPLALAVSLVAAPAPAQEETAPRQETERENCICFEPGTGENAFAMPLVRANRARIGVMLGGSEEVDGTTGVVVEDVVEDGPADDAGVRPGDVITALNGAVLGGEPARGIVEAMRDVEPGDTVTVTYYRDGQRRSADVVTSDASVSMWSGEGFDVRVAPRMDAERLRERLGELNVVTPRSYMRRLWISGLELAEVNPALGEYFGTDVGVLVTDIDDDSGLGLRPGDVILAIDGRDVRDAAHVRAILDSYRPDEEITFRVVRQEREMVVAGTIDG